METKEEYPFNVLFTSVNKMIVADPPALLKESYQAYKAEIRKKKEIQWQKNPPPPGLTEVQLWAWPHLPLPMPTELETVENKGKAKATVN